MGAFQNLKGVFDGRVGLVTRRLTWWVSAAAILGLVSTACMSGAEQQGQRLSPDSLEPCPEPVLEALDQNNDVAIVFVLYKGEQPGSGACSGRSAKPAGDSVTLPLNQPLPYTNPILFFQTNPYCYISGGVPKCVN
jgi:hypothetical protein